MNRKLGINASCLPNLTEYDALNKIKSVGFKAVFSETFDIKTVCTFREQCDRLGLSLEFLHAPFAHINDFWYNGFDYLEIYDGIKSSIDCASKAGVPIVILHVSSGWFPPQVCDLGFARFDEIVEYAVSKNVKVAFENLRKFGNHAAIMERYENNPIVGFCYDCGHEHCYTETVDFLSIYGNRMFCTHIHDNFGRDKEDIFKDGDYHLLPFDGNIDYAYMMSRIKKTKYAGTLMLEVYKKGVYKEMTDEDFLNTAYSRIFKISKL